MARYGAKVVVFEPVPVFYQGLRIHYVGNDRVSVRATALARTAGKASIAFSDNGSSIFGKQASMLEIDLESLEDYILSEGISTIACLKLNIEGSEYDVLEGLIERRLIHRISCLLIQFHTIEERSKLRRSEIQAQLAKTHTKVFDYPFVWERWDSRKDS